MVRFENVVIPILPVLSWVGTQDCDGWQATREQVIVRAVPCVQTKSQS